MEHYNLAEDEVVLYKGCVKFKDKLQDSLLILTNKFLVFITKQAENNDESDVETQVFSVSDIKIYKDIPQVKIESNKIEIYLKAEELEFEFDKTKGESKKFYRAIIELLTGKTSFERNVCSVKNKVDLVNDTFDVDVVKTTEGVVQNGISDGIKSVFGTLGNVGEKLLGSLFKGKSKSKK